MLKREDIRIRDPFIWGDREEGVYYMYGTTSLLEGSIAAGNTFSAYVSHDLENFEGPYVVVDGTELGLAYTKDFWAPEVHKYNGKYYLFGSMKADGKCRATQIFVADTPLGKFRPVAETPATPADWECLDGTLWVEGGTPYIVFCHEWLQVGDGQVCAMPLNKELTAPIGEPILLFRAGDRADVEEIGAKVRGKVTDGPFLYEEEGKLKMIWSSFSEGKYAVLIAESEGGVAGPWKHKENRFGFDGGHAMIFTDLNGKRLISLHKPNTTSLERAVFLEI